MSVLNYKRGSEWRKWDLHIHTPGSFHWRGKRLHEMNTAEKNVELEKFIEAVNNSDVAVFCIMDYWNFDWYLELQEYVKQNPGRLVKTVFPGMELRIECPVNYRLNIHCILSDQLSRQELIDFKSELYIRSIEKKLSNDALIRFAKSLDASKAQKHGFADPANLDEDQLLRLGSQTAEITKDSLDSAFKQIPPNSGFILLPYDTSDGLLRLDWSQHPHDDNYFMQSAHIFESRDQRNIDLISGIKTPENEQFFENFYKTLGSKPKPCVSGSDAHAYKDYGKYPSDRITWVKADPTFEGLKQIIYEPQIRVKISNVNPEELNKKFYLSAVGISNSTDFLISNEVLEINRDLVCIVGGRGSGKSALFECIAYCFDEHNSNGIDSSKRFDTGRRFDTDTFIDHFKKKDGCDATFELHFKDLDDNPIDVYSTTLKERINLCSLPILYLGQNKIEQFANDPTEIHRLAFETVLKNTTQADTLAASKLVIENKQQLLTKISKEIEALRENIRSLDESSLQDERKRIESELQLLSSEETKSIIASFNSTRLRKDTLTQLESLIGEIGVDNPTNSGVLNTTLGRFENEITNIVTQINGYALALNSEVEPIALDLSSFKQRISDLKQKINKDEINSQYNEALQQINEQLKGKTDLSVSYLESQKNRENEVKLKLEQLTSLKQNLQEKLDERENVLEVFKELYNQYAAAYSRAIKEFVSNNSGTLKSVQIDAAVTNNVYDLIDRLFDYADKRKARSYDDFVVDFLYIDTTDLDTLDYNVWIKRFKADPANFDVFNGLTENGFDEIVYSNYYSLETKISYEISEGDLKPLNRLSLGQKGTVLLKFYLSSGNNCPIFIDQPEDHLDNDFIYHDLVKTIRAAKIKRQVIMVTHDANLVVNGDADQVIVSKYSDQVISHDFSGSLENSTIRDAVSRILEGGKEAFQKREQKYQYEYA